MRTLANPGLTAHDKQLTTFVMDEPGSGGAHHAYLITGVGQPDSNPSGASSIEFAVENQLEGFLVLFQNGPIGEAGVNGIAHEVLLAILIDRLECFQKGPFANVHNAEALVALKSALELLNMRTQARITRGVEGTHQA